MKKLFLLFVLIFVTSNNQFSLTNQSDSPQIIYRIDVTNYQDDLFHVTVLTKNLSPDNNIYNFIATAPGTYIILDFGRFVHSFKAYDNEGNELGTRQLGTNRWEIDEPEELAKITYDIEDSYDADLEDHQISLMCGTGIQDEYIACNTFGVLGYFESLQSNPVKLKIDYKPDWTIGTAMDIDSEGYYYAETFDRLADSPILIGKLTTAFTKVNDMDVGVYVYTNNTSLVADSVLSLAEDVLESAGEFIEYSPVPYYKFLMVFMDDSIYASYSPVSGGALEHSYSSLHILPMDSPAEIRSIMAHEFMHILTPLNLHSEIIHTYNFAVPTASKHIWLYEGVTEWCSDIMQLRSVLMTVEEYLNELSIKLRINDSFSPPMSLKKMSSDVYIDTVLVQFYNFYCRGAVTAALLDIRLLELSNGKSGLRELFLELLDEYGKYKPFPEKDLFDVIIQKTYPEIEQFINNYIIDTKTLPLAEYMSKVGINYFEEKISDDNRPALGVGSVNILPSGEFIVPLVKRAKEYGMEDGDIIVTLLGTKITRDNIRAVVDSAYSMNIGDEFDLVVKRNDEEIALTGVLLPRIIDHAFEVMEKPTPEQKYLREQWMKNL